MPSANDGIINLSELLKLLAETIMNGVMADGWGSRRFSTDESFAKGENLGNDAPKLTFGGTRLDHIKHIIKVSLSDNLTERKATKEKT